MHATTGQAALIEAAIAQSLTAVVITDADLTTGGPRVEYCNEAFCTLTGYSADEWLGRPLPCLDGPHTDERARQAHRRCLAEGRVFRGRLLQYRKDGTAWHADWVTSPVFDDHGMLAHFASVCEDVSTAMTSSEWPGAPRRRRAAPPAGLAWLEGLEREPLTGLLTRHACDVRLRDIHHEARVADRPYALVLAELDYFDRITDRHGWLAGDRVLVRVAAIVARHARQGDVVARWGGEAFLLVLPDARLDEARTLASHLQADVAATTDEGVGAVTISVGVAAWQPRDDMADVVTRVDDALYVAKTSGRNRVERAWTEPAGPAESSATPPSLSRGAGRAGLG